MLVGIIAAASLAGGANAANLVSNGGFEIVSNGLGQPDFNTTLSNWKSSDSQGNPYYNFVLNGATADTAGASGVYGGLTLWGPGNGVANGLGPSPDGGNFVAADGAFITGPLTQTLTGLTSGKTYVVNFYWGAAQQTNFTGPQTEWWEVSLGGGPSQFTSIYANPTAGFSGWFTEHMSFKADGSTQVLSFLAHGTPNGVPPFSLLDGVSVNGGVPEASTWAMMIAGFGLVGAAARRRRQVTVAA